MRRSCRRRKVPRVRDHEDQEEVEVKDILPRFQHCSAAPLVSPLAP